MPRQSVNALSDRKGSNFGGAARLDTALFRAYTLPFALDGGNLSYQDYSKAIIREEIIEDGEIEQCLIINQQKSVCARTKSAAT